MMSRHLTSSMILVIGTLLVGCSSWRPGSKEELPATLWEYGRMTAERYVQAERAYTATMPGARPSENAHGLPINAEMRRGVTMVTELPDYLGEQGVIVATGLVTRIAPIMICFGAIPEWPPVLWAKVECTIEKEEKLPKELSFVACYADPHMQTDEEPFFPFPGMRFAFAVVRDIPNGRPTILRAKYLCPLHVGCGHSAMSMQQVHREAVARRSRIDDIPKQQQVPGQERIVLKDLLVADKFVVAWLSGDSRLQPLAWELARDSRRRELYTMSLQVTDAKTGRWLAEWTLGDNFDASEIAREWAEIEPELNRKWPQSN